MARGPALPPLTDGVGMEIDLAGGFDVGQSRLFVEE
jgi:hypothetical protein